MQKRSIKIFSIFFALFLLLSAFPLATYAADPGLIEVSGVEADLKAFGVDITEYQKDVTAAHCRMLKFLEYGYDYYGGTADYGLYVYLWNPSGKEIDTVNGSNSIQMSTLSSAGTIESDWRKLKLKMISYSLTEGYEYVFYKFQVQGVKDVIHPNVEKGIRQYGISGIEVQYKGDRNPSDFKVAGTYSFTGYMPYHDAGRVSSSSLTSYVHDRITVDLELNPVSWKTNTSDKGAGYQYEMFGVYFSVPNDIIRDYGDTDDPTKGLVEVKGSYEEYKVNGIVTPYKNVHDTTLQYLHAELDEEVPFGFAGGYSLAIDEGCTYFGFSYNLDYVGILPMFYDEEIDYICTSFWYDEDTFSKISSEELFDQLYANAGSNGFYVMRDVDDGRQKGFQYYTVSVEDGLLNKQIASFASSHSKFVSWLIGQSKLYDENETYGEIEPIKVVSNSDFLKDSIYLDDAAVADKLFIQESEVEGLQSYVASSILKDKTTYLMRFAVRDYFCQPIHYHEDGLDNDYNANEGNYYYEKTFFHDFDVLSLTYENAYGERTVIPVVCDPIDVGGNITPPADGENPNTEPAPTLKEVVTGCKDLAIGWKLLIFLGGLLLISWLLGLLGISFKDIFRAIGAPFRWAGKQIRKLTSKAKEKKKKKKKKKTREQKKKKTREQEENEKLLKILKDDLLRERKKRDEAYERENKK